MLEKTSFRNNAVAVHTFSSRLCWIFSRAIEKLLATGRAAQSNVILEVNLKIRLVKYKWEV